MLDLEIIDKMCVFSRNCENAGSVDQLEAIIKAELEDIKINMFAYHHLPPLGAADSKSMTLKSHFGFPESWLEFYKGYDFSDGDPLVSYGFQKNRPFWWSEILNLCPSSPRERSFISEAKKLDVSIGLALPVFGAKARNGFFVIGFKGLNKGLSDFKISMLQWASQIAHYRYVDLLEEKVRLGVELTKREGEILKWVADGKSNSEIAGILGISKHTIDSYLRRVFLKLDVTERVSASLRGMSLGLI